MEYHNNEPIQMLGSILFDITGAEGREGYCFSNINKMAFFRARCAPPPEMAFTQQMDIIVEHYSC